MREGREEKSTKSTEIAILTFMKNERTEGKGAHVKQTCNGHCLKARQWRPRAPHGALSTDEER